ncbi:hypothetical protein ACH4TX_28365 [Streptomyces sp. NPDC021098]|uniref:hypothetical protein n=1 Tax=unclassified Streptomyces TaxID=2593676 RepID=UPI0037B9483E
MPLPFLTADRAHDDDRAGPEAAPLSRADVLYEDPGRKRRPYRPGPWRVGGSAVLLLLASYLLFSALIIALAGSGSGAGVCVGAAALVIGFAVRLVGAGVRTSERELRRTGLFSSTTVAWQDVASIRNVQQPVRLLGLPHTVQGQAVLVERASGGAPLTLFTSHDTDFLGRPEAFRAAADALGDLADRHGR